MTENTIKQLQERLRQIGHTSGELPTLAVDGTYGQNTRDAVMAFQKKVGLEVTGEINYETWETIYRYYEESLEISSPPRTITPFTGCDSLLRKGETAPVVSVLQVMLLQLSERFPNIPAPEMTGVYDEKTANSVRFVQRLNELDESGETDKKTWNVIAELYNAYYGRVC